MQRGNEIFISTESIIFDLRVILGRLDEGNSKLAGALFDVPELVAAQAMLTCLIHDMEDLGEAIRKGTVGAAAPEDRLGS